MALGQPLDPSTWNVGIPKLKQLRQEQNETLNVGHTNYTVD